MSDFEKPSELLDLVRGLPTTAEDVSALWRLRKESKLSDTEYFAALARFPAPTAEELRRRPGPRGDEPFRL